MAVKGVRILAKNTPTATSSILTDDALAFLAALHRTFDATRLELLRAREATQQRLDAGEVLDFPPETAHIRAEPAWHCAPPAPGLEDRRVEITGPPDRKMVINALNSGAKTFMADFEGTHSGCLFRTGYATPLLTLFCLGFFVLCAKSFLPALTMLRNDGAAFKIRARQRLQILSTGKTTFATQYGGRLTLNKAENSIFSRIILQCSSFGASSSVFCLIHVLTISQTTRMASQ